MLDVIRRNAVLPHQADAGVDRRVPPPAAGIRFEVKIHHLIFRAEVIEIMPVFIRLEQVLVALKPAQRVHDGERPHHDAEGHTILVHGGIFHAADARYKRRIEFRDGEDIVHLLPCEAVNAPYARRDAHRAERAARMRVLIVIHDRRAAADGGLIGHEHRRKKLVAGNVFLICSRKYRAHKRRARMCPRHVVPVVDVICVGGMAHRSRCAHEVEALRRADYGDVALAVNACGKAQPCLKLAASAADHKRAHQIHKAPFHARPHFLRQILPAGV